MNRFDSLQDRWIRYRRRLALARFFWFLVCFGLLADIWLGFYLWSSYDKGQRYFFNASSVFDGALMRGESNPAATLHSPVKEPPSVVSSPPSPLLSDSTGSPTPCYRVVSQTLNVRQEPNGRSPVLGRYLHDDLVCGVVHQGPWLWTGGGWVFHGVATLKLADESEDLSGGVLPTSNAKRDLPREITRSTPVHEEVLHLAKSETLSGDFSTVQARRADNLSDRVSPSAMAGSVGEKREKSEGEMALPSTLQIVSQMTTEEDRRSSLIREYHAAPSYALAMQLARNFFDAKEYNQSSDWALRANQHDNYPDDSWSVFAKSLYFLGKKQNAIEALEGRLRFQYSETLNVLLEEIRGDILKAPGSEGNKR